MAVNKKYYKFCFIIGLVILMCLYFWKEEGIHNRISNLKQIIADKIEYRQLHKHDELISSIGCVEDEDEDSSWYVRYHVIAHGGGGINGYNHTNSLEAIESHYANETRLFDLDVEYTSEGTLVLRHDWKENMETSQSIHYQSREYKNPDINVTCFYDDSSSVPDSVSFVNSRIFNSYTPLTIKDLFIWLDTHPDALFLPDFKKNIASSMRGIVHILEEMDKLYLLQRIIIRVRNYNEFQQLRDLNGTFPIAYRKYDINKNDTYYDILKWCVENNIHVIIFPVKLAQDPIIKVFEKHGVHVWIGVVDYYSDYTNYASNGVKGVVSNRLFEKQFIK